MIIAILCAVSILLHKRMDSFSCYKNRPEIGSMYIYCLGKNEVNKKHGWAPYQNYCLAIYFNNMILMSAYKIYTVLHAEQHKHQQVANKSDTLLNPFPVDDIVKELIHHLYYLLQYTEIKTPWFNN